MDRKWREMNKHFLKENIKMPNRHHLWLAGNANKNRNKILSHTNKNDLHYKGWKQPFLVQMWWQSPLLALLDLLFDSASLETMWRFLRKVRLELPYNLLQGHQNMHQQGYTYTYSHSCNGQAWKQPSEWRMKKLQAIYTMEHSLSCEENKGPQLLQPEWIRAEWSESVG